MLTLFGGEPLLNLPVAYYLAEQCHALCEARGIPQGISVITNGLLLTPEVVDRLKPYGLHGVKVTLDGDRDTHNRMRPLRGRQGTFDKIVENVRRVAHMVPITIGGNFDESSVDSYPALLDFLREQEFADKIAKINFKPIIKSFAEAAPKGVIPLTVVGDSGKPLNGTCMTSAGAGSAEGIERLRLLPLRRREDVVPARGDAEARLPDARRRAHGPVRDSPAARPHDRTRRLALRVPRIHRRRDGVDRPHRRPRGDVAAGGRGALRASQPAERRMRRLLVHSRVRRRLFRGRAHRAR